MTIIRALFCCVTAVSAFACWSESAPFGEGGNDGICSGAGCTDSVSIDVSRRDEQIFVPAEYEFDMEIESGNPIAVSCTLSSEASLSCSGDTNLLDVRLNDDFDIFTLRIENASPDQLFVAVYKDDSEIGEDILAPGYDYITGNDPDCTATCVQGNVEMRVASGE
jgi:hypothetical protein